MKHERRITDDDVAYVREDTGAADQSIYRRALGLPVRGRVVTRIDRALEELGIVCPDVELLKRTE
jgi:hypothetical protein